MKNIKPENKISDLKEFGIVDKAEKLLDSVIVSSEIHKNKRFTENSLKEAKLVGSFSNTLINAIGKKYQILKTEVSMKSLPAKISRIKNYRKQGKF